MSEGVPTKMLSGFEGPATLPTRRQACQMKGLVNNIRAGCVASPIGNFPDLKSFFFPYWFSANFPKLFP